MAQQWGVHSPQVHNRFPFLPQNMRGFDVEVLRAKSSEATTINLSATLVVGDKEQELPASITVPSSVHSQQGNLRPIFMLQLEI